jgi:3-oxoadipyl-CoA thiolase
MIKQLEEAVIVSAARTPIGKYGGALATVRPDDLGAVAIAEAVKRAGIDPAAIEDVYFGCANQAGEDNRNVARMSLLLAGLPTSVAGVTVNRLCGSGLQAINDAARAIMSGDGEIFIAGGVESMTRAPFVMGKAEEAYQRGNPVLQDTTLGWRFINSRLSELYYPYTMGETAENVAEQHKVSREDQDMFAYQSQQKAGKAIAEGKFEAEIVPVKVPQKKGEPLLFAQDEHPRPSTTLEALNKLKPAFRKDGSVTAGNSSGINDGAAALVIMSATKATELGLKPMARVVATAVAGVDPSVMGLGPIPASRKALARAGLTADDLDLIELNEAFASQSLACVRELGLDPQKVNVNGGAIALGHPLGCSGARLATTLIYELGRRKGRYGLATMCIGVGQGVALVVERL